MNKFNGFSTRIITSILLMGLCSFQQAKAATVDHYNFQFTQQGMADEARLITIKACADSNTACTNLDTTDPISLYITPPNAPSGNTWAGQWELCGNNGISSSGTMTDQPCTNTQTAIDTTSGSVLVTFTNGIGQITLNPQSMATSLPSDFATIGFDPARIGNIIPVPSSNTAQYTCNGTPWAVTDTPSTNSSCDLYFNPVTIDHYAFSFSQNGNTDQTGALQARVVDIKACAQPISTDPNCTHIAHISSSLTLPAPNANGNNSSTWTGAWGLCSNGDLTDVACTAEPTTTLTGNVLTFFGEGHFTIKASATTEATTPMDSSIAVNPATPSDNFPTIGIANYLTGNPTSNDFTCNNTLWHTGDIATLPTGTNSACNVYFSYTPPALPVHHYEFAFEQKGSSQEPRRIQITACPDDACLDPVDTTVTLTLSVPTGGSWGPGHWEQYTICPSNDSICLSEISNVTSFSNNAGVLVVTIQHGVGIIGLAPQNDDQTLETGTPASGNFPTLGITSATPALSTTNPYLYKCNKITWKTGDTPIDDGTATSNPGCNVYFENKKPLICKLDDFNRDSLGSDWASIPVPIANQYIPNIQRDANGDGHLVLTTAVNNIQSGVTYAPYALYTGGGYVNVTFDLFAYGSTSKAYGHGADGISFVLSDASIPTTHGGQFGGALGYSAYANHGSGFSGGWLGVGFDEYGTNSTALLPGDGAVPPTGSATGTVVTHANFVSIRGQGALSNVNMSGNPTTVPDYYTGYKWLPNLSVDLPSKGMTINTDSLPHQHATYRLIIDNIQRDNTNPACSNQDGSNHGKLCITLKRSIDDGVSFTTLVDAQPIDQTLPDSFRLSFVASTGGANNIHAIDNFQMCAEEKLTPSNQTLDHFEFDYSDNTPSCLSKEITITACADNATPCTPIASTLSTINMKPIASTTWVACSGHASCDNVLNIQDNTISFKNGKVTVALNNYDNSQPTRNVILHWNSSEPTYPPYITPNHDKCNGVDAPSSPFADCPTSFVQSGLAMIQDINHGIAGKPINNVTFTAVDTENADPTVVTDRCVPLFKNVTRQINFSAAHLMTVANDSHTQLNVDSLQSGGNPSNSVPIVNGDDTITGTLVDVYFDNNGVGTLDLTYPDAGKLKLYMQYDGTNDHQTALDGSPLILKGQSNPFIVRPYGLCITSTLPLNACQTISDPLTAAQCAKFHNAGQKFPLTITGKQWVVGDDPSALVQASNVTWNEATAFNQAICDASRPNTPSFAIDQLTTGANTSALSLSSHLIAPANGIVVAPTFNPASDIGSQTTINTSINEAGVFDIAIGTNINTTTPETIKGISYLDPTVVIPASVSGHLGTFVPAYFDISGASVTNTNNINSSSPFSYLDKPHIAMAFNITAKSETGQITNNYVLFQPDQLATFTLGMNDVIKGDLVAMGHNITCNIPSAPCQVAWTTPTTALPTPPATIVFSNTSVNVSRIIQSPATTTLPVKYTLDGPLTQVSPTITASVTPFGTIPIGSATGNAGPVAIITSTDPTKYLDLRFGYLKVNPKSTTADYLNRPVGQDLNINFEMQYYDDSRNSFVLSNNDNEALLYHSSVETSGADAIYQCRDLKANTSIDSYLEVPDNSSDDHVASGLGLLTIYGPDKEEGPATYWFLQGTYQAAYECLHNDSAVIHSDGVTHLTDAIQGGAYLQFDHRKDDRGYSPSTTVSFTRSPNSSQERKIIYRRKW